MTDPKKDHREATRKAVVWDDSEILRLQEIEGNPLDQADLGLFAAMDRAGMTLEEQRTAIIADDSEIVRLQEIEGNPFDAADDALFATMDRAGLSQAERLAVIGEVVKGRP